MDLLDHLATFVRIADAGSISQAGRDLGLSVAMTSRRLKALEADVGVELVRRSTRHLSLTEAGIELLGRARTLLNSADEARQSLRRGNGVAGTVVMSLPVSFGLAQVGPLFPALLEQHPQLKLELRFEDRVVDLLADGVDVAIRAGTPPPDSPFLIARTLTTMERVMCVAPSFLRRHGRIETLQDLERVPCVLQGATTRWRFDTDDGACEVAVSGRLRTNTVIAIRDAALAGAGVARLPRWIVHEDLLARRLVPVLPRIGLPPVDVIGLFHRSGRSSGAVRAVLDHLAVELPQRMPGTHTKREAGGKSSAPPAGRPRRRSRGLR